MNARQRRKLLRRLLGPHRASPIEREIARAIAPQLRAAIGSSVDVEVARGSLILTSRVSSEAFIIDDPIIREAPTNCGKSEFVARWYASTVAAGRFPKQPGEET